MGEADFLCRLSDLDDPGSRGFELELPEGTQACFLVRQGDCVRAYRNNCPHTGAPLDWIADRFLDASGELIQCALHGALFDIATGECLRGPCAGAFLKPVEVLIENGLIRLRKS